MGADVGWEADKTDTIGESGSLQVYKFTSLQEGWESSPTPPLVLHRDFVRFYPPAQSSFVFTPTIDVAPVFFCLFF